MVAALAVIVILFQVWTSGILLKPLNVTNIVQQNGYILILAIGMVIVIISGHIDLSVGSIAGFIGAMSAVLMIRHAHAVAGRAGGLPAARRVDRRVAGLLDRLCRDPVVHRHAGRHAGVPRRHPVPAGRPVHRAFPAELQPGQQRVPARDRRRRLYHWPTVILGVLVMVAAVWQQVRQRRTQSRYGFDVSPVGWFVFKCAAIVAALAAFTLLLASYRGVPVVGIILAVAFVIYAFVMRSTVFGRQVYAVGGNVAAARLSGVKTKRVTFLVFVNMGLLSALAGLLFAARLNSATPQAGIGMELEAIAAAFIGGASANGGVGTVFGAIIGGFVLGVLNNGMSLIGIGSDVQQVIKGLVLLAAVGFDVYNKKKGGS